MQNIYSQSDSERNSIVELPEGCAEQCGNTLMRWLGSFWKELHKGNAMVKGVQGARGYVLAQAYLDILEALKLQDRQNAPVFHRELWYPMVIRRLQADTAQDNLISLGVHDAVIGEQPPGSDYGEGTILQIGRLGNFEKYVTYPVVGGSDIRHVASAIVDNILNPTVVMRSGEDFRFDSGSLVFPRELDPFREGTPFDVYDVPGDSGLASDSDRETVLWASDVYLDRDYVANHVSYPLGASAPSVAEVKRIVNAAWDAVSCGLTPQACSTLIAAMLNVPVVQGERETVVDISSGEDGVTVTTDAGKYKVSPKAVLRDVVKSGAVLRRGDLLDESVRIYPALTNPDPGHVGGITGFSVPIFEDVPSISIPPALLSASTSYGIYVTWDAVTVKKDEAIPEDANGNPRLYFDVYGQESDVKAFWNAVWADAEASGTNMEDIVGREGSAIVPAEYFLRNMLGANTLVITVDAGQIDDISMMRNPMFFGMLSSVVPSAMRLLFVERRPTPEADEANLEDTREATSVSAGLKALSRSEGARDGIVARLVRPAPPKTKSKGET